MSPVTTNYITKTISFTQNNQIISLQGIQSEAPDSITTSQLNHFISKDSIDNSFLCFVSHEQPIKKDIDTMESDTRLQQILTEFHIIFQTPSTLPPIRSHDHKIPLQQPDTIIKVKPYRYPHFQKNEIEKLLQDMFSKGFIRPSSSSFSSPVLLIKKKDGSWRFCVDYRALNAITVKDSFPMPTIDELIDELHGAHYFSILDLHSGYHQIRMNPEDIHKTAFRTQIGRAHV